MRLRLIAALPLVLLLAFALLPAFAPAAHAQGPLVPDCKPWLFPDKTDACGFSAFEELVVNVIKWLLFILFPIGFCIIAWAGFRIMTSAGDGERVHEAYGMIKIVVIGIIIALLSYIIIVNIFNVLNVKTITITPIKI